MRNPGLEEAQAGIKIAGRNINNLRYADDTTLMAESEEELKSLLMKVKEENLDIGSSKKNPGRSPVLLGHQKALLPSQKTAGSFHKISHYFSNSYTFAQAGTAPLFH